VKLGVTATYVTMVFPRVIDVCLSLLGLYMPMQDAWSVMYLDT